MSDDYRAAQAATLALQYGPSCPQCGSVEADAMGRSRCICRRCGAQYVGRARGGCDVAGVLQQREGPHTCPHCGTYLPASAIRWDTLGARLTCPRQCTYFVLAEHWQPVPGYEGRYSVSDLGRVRGEPYRAKRVMGRGPRGQGAVFREVTVPAAILCQSPGGRRARYRRVQLHDWHAGKNRRKYAYVHALVLAAFVGPRPEGAEILHGEGGPGDNRLVNLAYGSREENLDDEAVKLWLKNNPHAEPSPF